MIPVTATPVNTTNASSRQNPPGARAQTKPLTLPYKRDITSYASAPAMRPSATSSGRTTPTSTPTTTPSALYSTPATDCTTSFTSCTNPAHSPKPESLAPSRTLTDSIPPSPPIYPPNEPLAWPLFSSTTHILGPPPRFAERILPTPPSPPFPSNLFLSYFRAKARNRVLPLY